MKAITKRLIALLLIAVLTAGLLPAAALADGGWYPTVTAPVTMVSNFGGAAAQHTDECYYSDSWFLADSATVNAHLATLSAIAGGVSYSNDADERGGKITAMLEALGFDSVELNAYYAAPVTLEDSIGCAVGCKTITDSAGKQYTLLAVMPRNAGYRQEWAGDFHVGAEGLHAGFRIARDEVLRFLRQYLAAHAITGDVKVWIAGYSRGGAVANLLGGFLADDSGYFGEDVSIAPRDVFVYTIGTPLTIPAMGVTRADALSVTGGDELNAYDTDGNAYVYAGSDAAEAVDPADARFAGNQSYTAAADYLSKLPPTAWGFTRYGVVHPLDYGGEDMMARLALYSSETAEKLAAYPSYLASYPDTTFDLQTLQLRSAGGAFTPDGLISEHLAAVTGKVADRAQFSGGAYEAVLGAVGTVYGVAGPELLAGLSGIPASTLAKAGALNILAYVSEQQASPAGGPAVSDDAALAELAMQFMALAGKPVADRESYTAQQFLSDLLNYLFYDADALTRANAIEPLIAQVAPQLDAQKYSPYVGLYKDLTAYAIGNDTEVYAIGNDVQPAQWRTADDLLLLISGFMTANRSDPIVQALVGMLADAVPANYTGMLIALGQQIDPSVATAQGAVFAILRGFVEGVPASDLSAQVFRSSMTTLLLGVAGVSSSSSIYQLVVSPGDREIPLANLIRDILAIALKDENGDPYAGLADAANASLAELVDAVRALPAGGAADLDVLAAHPGEVRAIVTALLFAPGSGYSLSHDMRSALTALSHTTLIGTVHFHELYISRLKTQDSLYRPQPDYPVYPDDSGSGSGTDKDKESKPEKLQSVVFSDVKPTDWAYEAIQYVVREGLFLGTVDGAFSPELAMTRGMFMTVLARMDGETVDGEDWQEKGMAWSVAKGVSDGSDPERPITRQELVTMLWRLAGSPEPAGDLTARPDGAEVEPWAAKAAAWAIENGVMNGDENGFLHLRAVATRAEVAQFVMNYLSR